MYLFCTLFVTVLFHFIAHSAIVTLYEEQNGYEPYITLDVKTGTCKTVPKYGNMVPLKSIKSLSECVKVWQFSQCTGQFHCICEKGFVNLEKYLDASWSDIGPNALSTCVYADTVEATVKIYDSENISGDSKFIYLHKDKCETNIYAGSLRKLKVLKGCVKYFWENNCTGQFVRRNVSDNFNETDDKQFHEYKLDKAIYSLQPCESMEDSASINSLTNEPSSQPPVNGSSPKSTTDDFVTTSPVVLIPDTKSIPGFDSNAANKTNKLSHYPFTKLAANVLESTKLTTILSSSQGQKFASHLLLVLYSALFQIFIQFSILNYI